MLGKKIYCIMALAVLSLGGWVIKEVVTPPPRPDVTITGPIVMADGIGRQLVELALTLQDHFHVRLRPNHVNKEDVPSSIFKLIDSKKNPAPLGKVIISEESLWSPGEKIYNPLKKVTQDDQIRIAYSMLEFTRIPPEWALKLNLYYDMVVVPDPFLVEAYQKSGVRIPIFVLPLGLNLQGFLQQPLKTKRNPTMVFANLSSALDRKNQLTLIRAFAKVLGNAPDACLQINYRGGDSTTKKELLKEIEVQNCSNIYLTEFSLRGDAYAKLFQTIDCYVSLSKGEGFSIQPREAMALGIPVIATDNTGQTTVCQSGLVFAVESPLLEPAFYCKQRIPAGHQFACTVEAAAEALLDVYTHYEEHLDKGAKAREWASSYDYTNPKLKALYKSMIKPSIICLGKENAIYEDRLITTSPELYEKYQRIMQCQSLEE